jgi:hypothetical protein
MIHIPESERSILHEPQRRKPLPAGDSGLNIVSRRKQTMLNMLSIIFLGLLGFAGVLFSGNLDPSSLAGAGTTKWACNPTKPDSLGPFYEPSAPVRSSVDKGYVLNGTVKTAADCSALVKARIEFWLAGPDGKYDDAHRATVFSNESGRYRFESNFPPSYGSRPPHIHIRVTAEGYKPLVTQHYPSDGQTEAAFDLVLIPAA